MYDRTALRHYRLQIVPTVHKYLNGTSTRVNQYSSTEANVDEDRSLQGVVIAGSVLKEFYGVVVTYDFYPVSSIRS